MHLYQAPGSTIICESLTDDENNRDWNNHNNDYYDEQFIAVQSHFDIMSTEPKNHAVQPNFTVIFYVW